MCIEVSYCLLLKKISDILIVHFDIMYFNKNTNDYSN